MSEGRSQGSRRLGIAGGHQRGGVLPLLQADRKAGIAQRPEKRRKFCRNQARDLIDLVVNGTCAADAHATLPNRRSATSRVRRDLSSWVLTRHINVSCPASGA